MRSCASCRSPSATISSISAASRSQSARRQVGDEGAHEIVLQVGQQHAHRAQRRGFARNDLQRDLELVADLARMDRARAAGGDERKLARVVAALDRDFAHALRHVVADHAEHPRRRLFDREPHRLRDVRRDGLARGVEATAACGPRRNRRGRGSPAPGWRRCRRAACRPSCSTPGPGRPPRSAGPCAAARPGRSSRSSRPRRRWCGCRASAARSGGARSRRR